MFARVMIFTGAEKTSPAVPREAIVYEGDVARVWVAGDDKAIELRRVELGLTNGNLVQVVSGLKAGEKIVTKGTLFIDRAASGSRRTNTTRWPPDAPLPPATSVGAPAPPARARRDTLLERNCIHMACTGDRPGSWCWRQFL
jgi:hypothetical protein